MYNVIYVDSDLHHDLRGMQSMPDADILRDKLTKRERTVYEQICEGLDSHEDLANRLLELFRQKIRKGKLGVFQLMHLLNEELKKLPQEPLFKLQVDSRLVLEKLEGLAQAVSMQTDISQRDIEIAVEACDCSFRKWQSDLCISSIDESEAVGDYLVRQYESVGARMLAQESHPYNVTDKELDERLQHVKELSIPILQRWARSIVKHQELKQLRLQSLSGQHRKKDLTAKLAIEL